MPGDHLSAKQIVNGEQKQRSGHTGGGAGVYYDPDTGEEVLPEQAQKIIDWLLSWPNQEPKTVKEFCKRIEYTYRGKLTTGITQRTYYKWKNDPRFQRVLEREARRYNISTERVQSVTNTFFEIMMDRDMKGTERLRAGELYMKYVDRFMPKPVVEETVSVDDVSELTDEELQEAILKWTGAEIEIQELEHNQNGN